MRRLPREAPNWIRDYIGLEFKDGGRDKGGVDCWGLLRLIYAERAGIMLPSLSGAYTSAVRDRQGIVETFLALSTSGDWTPATEPLQPFDAVAVSKSGQTHHVGIMIAEGRMLHIEPDGGGNPKIERIDSEAWKPRTSFWRFTGGPRLVGRLSPFRPDKIDRVMVAGMTISQMLDACGVIADPSVQVRVSGRLIPPQLWGTTKPKPGREVSVTIVPRGGGGDNGAKNTRVVLTLGVIALAIAAPWLAGGVAGTSGLALFSVSATGGAFLSAGVLLAGALAINALIPPPQQRLDDISGDFASSSTTSNAATGGQNRSRPYGPVPMILGSHRVTPDLAAQPYTEVIGDDQYLRMLFNVGYGELQLSDFKIGETDLLEFEGVQIQTRSGLPTDPPMTLFPGTVIEEAPALLLQQADSWNVRTSATDADELSVDVTFPQGLAIFNPDGSLGNWSVSIEIEYAVAGSGTWVKINGDGGSTGSPTTQGQMDFMFRSPEASLIANGYVGSGTLLNWGPGYPGTKPAGLPSTNYSAIFDGYIAVAVGDYYAFAIDSSDAADLFVDDILVATFYGTHGMTGAGLPGIGAHHGVLFLVPGWHRVTVRMEARSTTGGLAVAWLPNGATEWAYLPYLWHYQPGPLGGSYVPGYAFYFFSTSLYLSTYTFTANHLGQIRRGFAWAVPQGQYDIRIRRTTADTNSTSIIDKIYWSSMRTIRHDDPVKLTGQARVALRIKATDQLNGIIDNFNLVATSVLDDWDPDAGVWIKKATSNPASCYRAIFQSQANKRAVANERMDLAELQAWHEECMDRGLECNAVLDFAGTVYQRAQDVAAAGRARFGMREGKYSIVRDRVQTTPVQHFTPRNSWGFKGSKAFPDIPHAFRVRFMNRETGYQQDERVVFDDGYSANGAGGTTIATKYEELQTFGVTDSDQAWKHGRYFLAVAKLRPEIFELSCDLEHIVCNAGDLVMVTHDVPLWGLGYGRVLSVNKNGDGDAISVTLDEAVPMETGGDYKIRFRLDDGTSLIVAVDAEEGEHDTLVLGLPIPSGEPMPKPGDLWMFGPVGLESRELVVKSIAPDKDLSAKLTLVDHAPGVHDADTGEIPEYTSGITRPPAFADGPEMPVIDHILSDDTVMVREPDGSLRARIIVYLQPQTGLRPRATASVVRTRIKADSPAETFGPWRTHPTVPISSNSVPIEDVQEGVTYQIRVRNVTDNGRASPWTEVIEHTVIGKTRPPPDVYAFSVTRMADGTRRFSWTLGTIPPDIAGVLIRYKLNEESADLEWTDLTALHTGVLEGASPTELPDPYPSGRYTFGIKMVDTSGIESENAFIITADLGLGPSEGVAFTFDCKTEGWPGSLLACHINGDNFLEMDADQDLMMYVHPIVDLGLNFEYTPAAIADAMGWVFRIEFRHGTSHAACNAATWHLLTDFSGSPLTDRYVQFRVIVAATAENPVPIVRRFTVLIRAQVVQQTLNDLRTADLSSTYRYSAGDLRVPISEGLFAVIRSVSVSFNQTGAGWTWDIVDKSVIPGPRIRIYKPDGLPGDATIDVVIRGLAGASSPTLLDLAKDGPEPLAFLDFSNPDQSALIPIM